MAEEVGQSVGSGEILLRSVQEQAANTLMIRLMICSLPLLLLTSPCTLQNDPLGFSYHIGMPPDVRHLI